MVYGIIGMINFAHGEIFMIGAFISIITMSDFSPKRSKTIRWPSGVMSKVRIVFV